MRDLLRANKYLIPGPPVSMSLADLVDQHLITVSDNREKGGPEITPDWCSFSIMGASSSAGPSISAKQTGLLVWELLVLQVLRPEQLDERLRSCCQSIDHGFIVTTSSGRSMDIELFPDGVHLKASVGQKSAHLAACIDRA